MAGEEVKYIEEGEPGRRCADCELYEPSPFDPSKGKCIGYDVEARGSCNYFEAKE